MFFVPRQQGFNLECQAWARFSNLGLGIAHLMVEGSEGGSEEESGVGRVGGGSGYIEVGQPWVVNGWGGVSDQKHDLLRKVANYRSSSCILQCLGGAVHGPMPVSGDQGHWSIRTAQQTT